MSLLRMLRANLRHDALTAGLNMLLLVLGMATITVLLLLGHQIEQRLHRDAQNIDLVVGAPGSPLQLILSSIFHLDIPTGNIPLEDARWVDQHPMVEASIPLALGDSYRGFRIVGTEPSYIGHYGGNLARGALWDDAHGAVLGAEAARRTGMDLGDPFHGVHGITSAQAGAGLVHADHEYRVSGVLEPTGTVLDRLILVSVESVWLVHDIDDHWSRTGAAREADGVDDRYLTALLVRYRTPLAAAMLPRAVDARDALQAASPAYETARLLQLAGIGMGTLQLFGWLFITMAALGFFATLYNALRTRRHDLAIMRTLGASRRRITALLLLEGVFMSGTAAILGLLLGHGITELLGQFIPQARQMHISGALLLPQEALMVAMALLLGLLAALVPAWHAYRTDIATVLQRRGD